LLNYYYPTFRTILYEYLIYKKLQFTASANLVDKQIDNQNIKTLVRNVGLLIETWLTMSMNLLEYLIINSYNFETPN